jgi:hypothetical protein
MTALDTPPKPTSLDIRAENGQLVGTDNTGMNWEIRWCGNGAYSHWTLSPVSNREIGYYVYTYHNNTDVALINQIRAAEKKHRIYS